MVKYRLLTRVATQKARDHCGALESSEIKHSSERKARSPLLPIPLLAAGFVRHLRPSVPTTSFMCCALHWLPMFLTLLVAKRTTNVHKLWFTIKLFPTKLLLHHQLSE